MIKMRRTRGFTTYAYGDVHKKLTDNLKDVNNIFNNDPELASRNYITFKKNITLITDFFRTNEQTIIYGATNGTFMEHFNKLLVAIKDELNTGSHSLTNDQLGTMQRVSSAFFAEPDFKKIFSGQSTFRDLPVIFSQMRSEFQGRLLRRIEDYTKKKEQLFKLSSSIDGDTTSIFNDFLKNPDAQKPNDRNIELLSSICKDLDITIDYENSRKSEKFPKLDIQTIENTIAHMSDTHREFSSKFVKQNGFEYASEMVNHVHDKRMQEIETWQNHLENLKSNLIKEFRDIIPTSNPEATHLSDQILIENSDFLRFMEKISKRIKFCEDLESNFDKSKMIKVIETVDHGENLIDENIETMLSKLPNDFKKTCKQVDQKTRESLQSVLECLYEQGCDHFKNHINSKRSEIKTKISKIREQMSPCSINNSWEKTASSITVDTLKNMSVQKRTTYMYAQMLYVQRRYLLQCDKLKSEFESESTPQPIPQQATLKDSFANLRGISYKHKKIKNSVDICSAFELDMRESRFDDIPHSDENMNRNRLLFLQGFQVQRKVCLSLKQYENDMIRNDTAHVPFANVFPSADLNKLKS